MKFFLGLFDLAQVKKEAITPLSRGGVEPDILGKIAELAKLPSSADCHGFDHDAKDLYLFTYEQGKIFCGKTKAPIGALVVDKGFCKIITTSTEVVSNFQLAEAAHDDGEVYGRLTIRTIRANQVKIWLEI